MEAFAISPALSIVLNLIAKSDVGDHWNAALSVNEYFLKVYDLSSAKAVQPRLILEETNRSRLDLTLETLPIQEESSVRVYFEVVGASFSPLMKHLDSLTSFPFPQPREGYSSQAFGALASQFRLHPEALWTTTYTYDLWQPQQTSDVSDLPKHLLRTRRSISCVETKEGGIIMVITSNPMLNRTTSASSCKPSTNEIWEFSDTLINIFCRLDEDYKQIHPSVPSKYTLKQLVLLRYQAVSLACFSLFLDTLERTFVKEREEAFDARFSSLNEVLLGDIMRDSYQFETIHDTASSMIDLTTVLMETLDVSLSEQQCIARFRILAAELKAVCSYIDKTTKRFSNRLDFHLKWFERSRNLQESRNVWLLSLLAAIFLPLSLATGILGMQTRFKDLNAILFDFCGVIVLLGTLVLVIIFGIKALVLASNMLAANSHRLRVMLLRTSLTPLLSALLSIGWALMLVSFLIGMVKDVVLGLKILGFGFAAFAGLLLTGIGLGTVFFYCLI